MSLLDDIKRFFRGVDMPEDDQLVIEGAESPMALIRQMEERKAKNLMDLREIEDRALLVERKIQEEAIALNVAGLSEGSQNIHARRLQMLEADRAAMQGRMDVFASNANMNLAVIHKIQEMDALRARGVTETLLDSLAETTKTEALRDSRVRMAASEVSEITHSRATTEQSSALEAIKKKYAKTVPEVESAPGDQDGDQTEMEQRAASTKEKES